MCWPQPCGPGEHLELELGVLPKALRAQSPAAIRAFEDSFVVVGGLIRLGGLRCTTTTHHPAADCSSPGAPSP
jgi:hypothetical protein